MKYPKRLIEPATHRRFASFLIKTDSRAGVTEPVEPEVPEPEPEEPTYSQRPPSLPFVPESDALPTPLTYIALPQRHIANGANYKCEIDGVISNEDHSRDLRYQNFNWDDGIGNNDITIYPYFEEWSCGADGVIRLTNTNEQHPNRAPMYVHESTICKVKFIPAPDQVTNYNDDGGVTLQELNPDGVFEFFPDGSFSVWMHSTCVAESTEHRSDDEYNYDRGYLPDTANSTILLELANGSLDYTVRFNGNEYALGELVGEYIEDGNYILSFGANGNIGYVSLDYTGELTDEIRQIMQYIHLTPNGEPHTWAHPTEVDWQRSSSITTYLDGVIILKLDVMTWTNGGVVPPPTRYYNYAVSTDFTAASVFATIQDRLVVANQQAGEIWQEWLDGPHGSLPEYVYEPTPISSFRVKTGIQNEDVALFANYTSENVEVLIRTRDGDEWVSWTYYTLIGDGSVYKLMKTRAMLRDEGVYDNDYVIDPIDNTFTQWVDRVGHIAFNKNINQSVGSEEPIDNGLLTNFNFIGWEYVTNNQPQYSSYVDLEITVNATVALKPHSVSNPTIGYNRRHPAITGAYNIVRGTEVLE